nr:HyaD/HybD family hydrogenase maturation endopeptidase [Thiorhodococcus mannitoliphagus]
MAGEGEAPWALGPNILILGIGNVLWADEGFGVRVIEEIAARFHFTPNVRVLDGGTQGIYLVDHIRWADVLVVFDAVDYGLAPGALKLVEGDEVPKFMGAKKMSLHQTGFQEVLAMADLLGDYPEHLLLVGVQPVELEDFGGSLRPEVKDQIEPAIRAARGFLDGFGVQWLPVHDAVDHRVQDVPHPSLSMSLYESGRPSAEAACRLGDARVLAMREQG